jgi:HEPN domain-containing protein
MHRKRVEAFLKIAEEELEAARRLQAALPRQAEYFLQQTTEKPLRAVLEIEAIPAGIGHGIADWRICFLPVMFGVNNSRSSIA